ncbi:MAG: hypothetical protein Q6361_02410 [Candidatus Hermodarchaeota archaeon]|nr:hypothetical protein [Candidatus Hermodarchaeota archaeon]
MNPLSITAPPLAVLIGEPGYHLDAILQVMHRMHDEGLVDGFEFQNLAEWDQMGPPKDKAQFEFRIKSWKKCPKYSISELADILNRAKLPIFSVHANRDVGICLCGEALKDIQQGERLIHDSLQLAEAVGAGICVFHLWDTWKRHFNLNKVKNTFDRICAEYPKVKASVENIPINLEAHTPFTAVKEFDYITLDLRWAATYDELEKFGDIMQRIVNVHLRGRLEADKWTLFHAPFAFYDALDMLRNQWAYTGLFTVEPEGGLKQVKWSNFTGAMASLR